MLKVISNLRNVVAIAACLAAGIIFSGCKEDNKDSSPAQSSSRVIKASELISKEDATAILEQSIDKEEEETGYYRDVIRYKSTDFSIDVQLYQKALYNGKDYAKWLKDMENAISKYEGIIKIDGIERAAYRQKGLGFDQWLLYVFYGDYYINICIGDRPVSLNTADDDTEEETAWKHAKLTETAKLAVEHLKEILKNW